MGNKLIIVFIFILSLVGCSKSKEDTSSSVVGTFTSFFIPTPKPELLTPTQYIYWAKEDNDITIHTKEIEDYSFRIQLIPTELLVLKDLGKTSISKREYDSVSQFYAGHVEFKMQISNKKTGSILQESINYGDYQDKVSYLSFNIQKDFKLVVNSKDTIPCQLSLFEPTYNVEPFVTLNLLFKAPFDSRKSDLKVIYNDHLCGLGELRFNYPKERLSKIPLLKI